MKTALITGITGQDGSYLAELLLDKGYMVYGLVRRSSSFNTGRIDHILKDWHDPDAKLKLIFGDLTDASSLRRALEISQPDEVYNLGAQSHVKVSFEIPEYTVDVCGEGVLRLLEAIRVVNPKIKFYQASSSEMYGNNGKAFQNEDGPFNPVSPYAAAKLMAYNLVRNWREAYGMFAVNGILFNHESPRRGETFVTRKIAKAAARIFFGLQECLYLGNLDAKRDWGYTPEYVEAMYLMMQDNKPDDYVVSTAKSHTVREFCDLVFKKVGMELHWIVDITRTCEVGLNEKNKAVVRVDPRYYRPNELHSLCGDHTKFYRRFKWEPKVGIGELAQIMVDHELNAIDCTKDKE